MHRFYCSNLPLTGTQSQSLLDVLVVLDSKQSHHAQKVLRLRSGECVGFFNGKGTTGIGLIEMHPEGLCLRITQAQEIPKHTPGLHIASAIPKGARSGDMVNQLCQLGADRFIPLSLDRSCVSLTDRGIERFNRVVIEACKQSGRAHLMEINRPKTLQSLFEESHDLRLIAEPDPGPSSQTQGTNVDNRIMDAKQVLIIIGPEGGWSDQERTLAAEYRCIPWTLAPHILRIETAAIGATAIAGYLFATRKTDGSSL